MQGFFISQKWSSNFGFDDDEVNFINYMATKNLVLLMKDTREYYLSLGGNENYEENCSTKEVLQFYKEMNKRNNLKLFVGKFYYFQDRMFCQKNISFENFISKVKKHYANKIKHYKSVKSLNYRRLNGKYPRFI